MTTRIDWNIAKRSMLERVLYLTKGIFCWPFDKGFVPSTGGTCAVGLRINQ